MQRKIILSLCSGSTRTATKILFHICDLISAAKNKQVSQSVTFESISSLEKLREPLVQVINAKLNYLQYTQLDGAIRDRIRLDIAIRLHTAVLTYGRKYTDQGISGGEAIFPKQLFEKAKLEEVLAETLDKANQEIAHPLAVKDISNLDEKSQIIRPIPEDPAPINPTIDFDGPFGEEIKPVLKALSAMQKMATSKDFSQSEEVIGDWMLAYIDFNNALKASTATLEEESSSAQEKGCGV